MPEIVMLRRSGVNLKARTNGFTTVYVLTHEFNYTSKCLNLMVAGQ